MLIQKLETPLAIKSEVKTHDVSIAKADKDTEEGDTVVLEIPSNLSDQEDGGGSGFIFVATIEDGTEKIIPMSELQLVERTNETS